jgi:hypothetical protein
LPLSQPTIKFWYFRFFSIFSKRLCNFGNNLSLKTFAYFFLRQDIKFCRNNCTHSIKHSKIRKVHFYGIEANHVFRYRFKKSGHFLPLPGPYKLYIIISFKNCLGVLKMRKTVSFGSIRIYVHFKRPKS